MWGRIYPHVVLLILANTIFKVSCKGNGSLTFLIDETSTMSDDIYQVRESVDKITRIVIHEKSSLIDNMVLVTFNDPGVYDRIVTRDPVEFKKALALVTPHNEAKRSELDCWEPSMKGLLLALNKSKNNSYIFVFTDAPAKDYFDGQYVIEMCQKKQTQIVFVLTGRFCQKFPYVPEARNVYFDIAVACSGLAIFVKKNEVEKVFGPIEEIIKGNKAVITTATVPAGVSKNIPFTTDDHTDYVIVSASGKDVTLEINDPSVTVKEIMSTDNAIVVKLSNIKPGNYVATVKGKTKTSVVITGRTDFFFSHGFSELKPKSLSDTSPQPISDEKVYLSISVNDDNHSVRIEAAKILDMDGKPIIEKLPLTEISKNFYITDPFVAPSQRFKVAVEGIVKATNKRINRTAKIPVSPPPPKIAPKVQGVTVMKVTKGKTAVFECKVVSGFPAPKIRWLFWGESGSKFTTLDGSESVLRITNVEDKHGGKYKCVAENRAGKDDHITTLLVQDLPKIVSTDSNIYESTEGDASLRIPCVTAGLPKPSITWKLNGLVIYPNARYSIENGTLIIRDPKVTDSNSYTCEAKNEVGEVTATFRTYIHQAPQVSGVTNQKVRIGTPASIECTVVKGEPKPTITWRFMDNSGSDSPILGSDNVLHISSVENKHAGRYKCVARNKVGSNEHITTLEVQDPPKVVPNIYESFEGDAMLRIPCVAAGLPKPSITWKLNGQVINPSTKYSIEDGTLVIRYPNVSDTNTYTCEAKNEVGVVSATYRTYIKQLPKLSGVASKDVRLGTPASMIVKGEPKPINVPIAGLENTLRISSANKAHAGSYKCVAQNNLGSDGHVTTLIVEFAPEIIQKSTTIEGIEGDLALRIPCDVVGVPKPVIAWKLKGATITPDSKYLIEDGALVITKPTEKDSSLYTCEVKNYISTVSRTFQVTVEKLPTNFGTEHFVYLLQGETKELKCDAYSSASQSVQWFITKVRTPDSWLSTSTSPPEPESPDASSKDYSSTAPSPTITEDAGIKEPYIQIANALFIHHDGNYTCHVSDKHGNTHTHTYIVDVGTAPEFISDANSISNWRGSISDIIQNCEIQENVKPKPVVEWRFNGEVLTDMNSAGVGHYTCNVSNVHGSVQKSFDVNSSACLITRNLRDAQYMPLILNDKGFWHKFENTKQYIVVNQDEKITLSCPSQNNTSNSFIKFPKKRRLEAFCYKEDTFLAEGKSYKLSDLQCTNIIQPSVIRNKVKCSTETSELIRVGYNVPEFLEAYEVCFDTEKNMPLYTRIIMTETNNNGLSADYNWYTYPGVGIKQIERAFTCKDTMTSCCYSKSQLVNAIDFNDGPAKKSTFIDPLNVIPVWLPCDTSKPSWENINDLVRSQLAITDIVTWSGTHTLQEKNGVIIPRYLWKVVRLADDDAAAIVYVNDPEPTEKDIKCETKCNDKFTYCCSLPDFFESFDIHVSDIGESMYAVLDKVDPAKLTHKFRKIPQNMITYTKN